LAISGYDRSMRLGLLGPSGGHERELDRAARGLRDGLGAERVVYLGADRALDALVSRWAIDLVGGQGTDATLMTRATSQCLRASPSEIDGFLGREAERDRLRMFESLAGSTTRSVEIVGGKVCVLLYDKAHLEEEDILPATLLIFGKSTGPVVRQVGRRWFLSPGSFPDHGVLLVDDEAGDLRATSYAPNLRLTGSQLIHTPKSLKMRTQGEG
jgi:hypothetical protein